MSNILLFVGTIKSYNNLVHKKATIIKPAFRQVGIFNLLFKNARRILM